ncbi:AraC-like DNA-binding protein [Haloactinopolyspora alba]|uniref:AraC-like DNA-binding protein n=1 Tax=Haloactinopolyspora alba TaxID=648780 RepID=A0A2P8DKZ4_9ACTN|nr:AraC family transcriptional regulator [Haloactinopolyspora alba]PSK97868.1 AraC-like DNA-binding protein [Haloactinopolyspora alba]
MPTDGDSPRPWARYLTPTAVHQRLGLTCLCAGRQSGPAHCPPRVLDSHAAVLVLSGPGRLECGRPGTTYELTPPTLFWLFPGEPHTYGPSRGGWHEVWTLFDGSAVAAYEELGYLSRTEPVLRLDDSTAVRHTMDRLLEACHGHRPGVEVTAAHLVHELILTAHHSRRDPGGATDDAVMATLREHACTAVSVGEIAARLGLSLSALRRVVHRAGGCSPKGYIVQVRLNHAKALLAGSELTVAEIAREVGHHDPAYFTRTFTRHTGMPPGEFRRQQRRVH